MNFLSSHSRKSGFSLIEVAIALAIFVFGALAVVQIFPPALGVVRNNESRTTATQIGQSTLERIGGKSLRPPEAIFDVSAASTQPYKWNDYAAAVIGTSSKNASLPTSPLDSAFNASALNHFRYIYGEPHLIGSQQTVSLNFPQDTTVPALSTLEFFIDEIVENVQITGNGYLDFSNAYLASSPNTPFRDDDPSDPNDNSTSRPPNDYRENVVYYVSYRWRACVNVNQPSCTAFGSVQGVVEEPLEIPTDSAGYNSSTDGRVLASLVSAGLVSTGNQIIPGGTKVRVRRKFTVDPSGSSETGPSDRKIISITNQNNKPVVLYCNYFASDWRNLSDYSAPVNNIVQLPILGVEASPSDFPIFGVLSTSDSNTEPVFKSPDLGTGTKVRDAEKGRLEFSGTAIAGARFRTVYRTKEGWAHQLSVAPRNYVPHVARPTAASFPADNFPSEPWREYAWSPLDPSNLYFHASEAGKTVSVAYHNGGQTLHAVLTIDNIENAPSAAWWGASFSGFAPSGKVARVEISAPNGSAATLAAAILEVKGLSVQARTAWQNGDRYNQVVVPGYRTLMQQG